MQHAIYRPSGYALEYADFAANLYSGCSHGCKYCYAPSCLHTDRAKFHDAPDARPGVMQALRGDLVSMRNAIADKRILLCFTCDPYQPIEDSLGLTRQAIREIKDADLAVQMLTKGGTRACRDFELLDSRDAFAATFTFINDSDSRRWEPSAALPGDRMESLKIAHDLGITTWASLEPVIDPEQTLELIRATSQYVDLYKVGKLNHRAEAKDIDWADFTRRAVALLDELGKDRYVKVDMRKYLESQ